MMLLSLVLAVDYILWVRSPLELRLNDTIKLAFRLRAIHESRARLSGASAGLRWARWSSAKLQIAVWSLLSKSPDRGTKSTFCRIVMASCP